MVDGWSTSFRIGPILGRAGRDHLAHMDVRAECRVHALEAKAGPAAVATDGPKLGLVLGSQLRLLGPALEAGLLEIAGTSGSDTPAVRNPEDERPDLSRG